MHGRSIRLSARHERWIYAVLMLVYVTGIAWIVLHYSVNRGDSLEDGWHIVETWVLRAHGAAAMTALIALGSMLPVHVPYAWKRHRNLVSGVGMLATLVLLAATGWFLYYASGESIRAWSSYLHMVAGVAGPLALLWHLAYRNRTARASRQMERGKRPASTSPHAENVLSWHAGKNQSKNP